MQIEESKQIALSLMERYGLRAQAVASERAAELQNAGDTAHGVETGDDRDPAVGQWSGKALRCICNRSLAERGRRLRCGSLSGRSQPADGENYQPAADRSGLRR